MDRVRRDKKIITMGEGIQKPRFRNDTVSFVFLKQAKNLLKCRMSSV